MFKKKMRISPPFLKDGSEHFPTLELKKAQFALIHSIEKTALC